MGAWPLHCEVEAREMDSGGAGLFGTPVDFGRFLTALLAKKLVSNETFQTLMFAPTLMDRAKLEMFQEAVYENIDALGPEFVTADGSMMKLNFGLGTGIMNMEDLEGRRRKGSVTWSGMANSRWV